MATVAPRRFKAEAVETTTRSSKRSGDISDGKAANVQPSSEQTSTITTKPVRRFDPTPVETTTTSRRRFAVEPIETSVISSKDRKGSNKAESESDSNAPRRFKPIPIETSPRRSRKKFDEQWDEQTTSPTEKRGKRLPRKFAPQLIGTATRSRRAGRATPTICCPGQDGCSGEQESSASAASTPSPQSTSPAFDYSQNPLFLEIQRATSPVSRPRPRLRACQHSFRVPDLDPIESSESECSGPSSPVLSRSFSSFPSLHYKEPTRVRESVDESTSGYLLELAAKAAEKQLREQAMAAFANDEHHEHVAHFVDRDEEVESSADEENLSSSLDFQRVDWQNDQTNAANRSAAQAEARQNAAKPWGSPAGMTEVSGQIIAERRGPDAVLDRMRKNARPPMLGKDLVFPRCPSPEPARFDTTQGCDVVKKAMCYLSEQSLAAEKGESLWCGNGNGRRVSNVPSLWSTPSSRSPSRSGLWGGFCVDSGLTPPRGPTGLLTPLPEKADPLSPCPTPSANLLFPPTPPASHADFACIDEKLAAELSIEEEFGDDFITQVYNYLSLGYPSMARPFDEELSKFSKIPISELRQDDHLAQSRGYIRLGADGNLASTDITEESCMRWRALRVYVREWAKQHPGMATSEHAGGGVGTAVRRGSWAW